MPPLTTAIDFSSLTAFSKSEQLLARAHAEIQLANVCGGLLMMEAAFALHPIVQSARATTDYEGGYFLDIDVISHSGTISKSSDVLLALYEADEHSNSCNLDAAVSLPPFGHDKKLAADFSSVDKKSIETAEQAFLSAFDYILEHASTIFYQHVLSIAFTPADAPSMARMIHLDDAAALIERSRIARSASDAPPGPASSRI